MGSRPPAQTSIYIGSSQLRQINYQVSLTTVTSYHFLLCCTLPLSKRPFISPDVSSSPLDGQLGFGWMCLFRNFAWESLSCKVAGHLNPYFFVVTNWAKLIAIAHSTWMNEVNVDFKVELIGPKSESFMKHLFLLGFPFFLLLVSFLSLLPIFGSCFFNITRNLMILPHWLVDTMDNVWIWREYETLPQVVDPKVQVPWLSLQRWDTKFLNKLISKGLVCGALP